MDCMHCGNEFEAKRSDARYCSAKCRQQAKRLSVTDVTDNVTDKLSVTEAERIIKTAKAKPKSEVTRAEIYALPQVIKDIINRLCDSNPELYGDRDERFVRAVLYRRKFPGRVCHSEHFTGTMTDYEREHYRPE